MSLTRTRSRVQHYIPPSYLADNNPLSFGDVQEMNVVWDIKDANANMGKINLPEGGSVDVPVLAIGIGIIGQDLALLNGVTQPTLALFDADRDSWVGLDFSVDDAARLNKGGSAWLSIDAGGTIPAATDISSGFNGIEGVYDVYPTLTAAQEYRAAYFRINYRSTTPGNPVVTDFTAVEGCAASYTTEEAITFRGGHFRTYISADATSTMRTNIGADLSARCSYSGGTECVLESGSVMWGARIWMAPFVTDTTTFNQSGGLLILNEADGKALDHAIRVWAGVYGGPFNYCFYTDGGKFYQVLDGSVNGSLLEAGDSSAGGWNLMEIRAEDYRTLTTAQEYKGLYVRYNVRSTTIGAPQSEVTGVEGVAATYVADGNLLSYRGGYFRTYVNADATSSMKTAVGVEASARASYSGGAECVALAGTCFVGARIWMAPYFTDASIANVTNFHALWILNEAPGKFVTNAIKIDATTYDSGFTYCFQTDSGKFRMALDGSEAGSGLVAGETVTTSGDDWFYCQVDDYRTLTSAQIYNAAMFRYNVRETTGGAAQCEVNGVEGVVGVYVADTNLRSIRGGHFRFYINADATSSTKTAVGADISARASYSGGTECEALAGTCFTGARIWMAPWFTSGTLANINNFWGLWIYGEHTTQRNADAAIFINDAGGKFTDTIRIASGSAVGTDCDINIIKLVVTGTPTIMWDESEDSFSFNKPVIFGGTPVLGINNALFGIGDYTTPVGTGTTPADHLLPLQVHLKVEGSVDKWFASAYLKVTTDATNAATLSNLSTMLNRTVIDQNVANVYGIQNHVDVSANAVHTVKLVGMSVKVDTGSGTTPPGNANTYVLWVSKEGSTKVNLAGGCIVALIEANGDADYVTMVRTLSGATTTHNLYVVNDGTCGTAIYIHGTYTTGIDMTTAVFDVTDDDKSLLKLGGYDTANAITSSPTDNTFMASFHMDCQVNPTGAQWLAATYQKVTVSTVDQANLSFVTSMIRADIGKPITAGYGLQAHVKFSGTGDVSSEVCGLTAMLYGTAVASPAGLFWAFKADVRTVNTPAGRGQSAAIFAVTTVSAGSIIRCENLTNTVLDGILVQNSGTMTNAFYLNGTMTNFLAVPATGHGGLTVGTVDIAADLTADAYLTIDVGGVTYKALLWAI